jgi:hypothetical protein
LAAVEEFVAEAAVEALDPGVLPRRAGVDEHRLGTGEAAPVRNGVRDELGSVESPWDLWRLSVLDMKESNELPEGFESAAVLAG